jgi:hypothetical protein
MFWNGKTAIEGLSGSGSTRGWLKAELDFTAEGVSLDFNRTAHRIDRAGKLDQYAVTGRLDDVASMGGYGGVNDGFSDSL